MKSERPQAMRGVKRPQKDDSVCLLIARVRRGQVSHAGSEVAGLLRGLGVDGKVEHTPSVTDRAQRRVSLSPPLSQVLYRPQ